ncbi:MAG: phage portal protein family protein [Moorellales bacterium]
MAEPNVFLELGSTGLSRWGGYIAEEWLPDLQGPKAVKIYKEMRDNDPIIGAILFAIKMLCRQAIWRVEAAGSSNADKEAAAFLESCLYDMSISWQDTLTEILSMLVFGWSWHEIVYKRRLGDSRDPAKRSKYNDGRIGWRKLPIRAQETLHSWVFDDEGGVKAMKQLGPPDFQVIEIPIEKSLLFRTEATKGSPEGRSILRNAYKPYWFKKNIEIIEGIGVERDLAGLPIVWVPPNIANPQTQDERFAQQKFKELVTKVRRDQQEGVVMPLAYDDKGNKLYDFTLLSTGSRRQFDTSVIIQRYNTQIAQTVLADFIMLGTQKVGSFALASSKTHLFAVAIGAFLDEIEDVFNTHAVPRLFKLNDFKVEKLPQLRHGDIEDVDLEELGNFISKLAGAGMPLFPNKELEKWLLEAANLPSGGVENEL